MDQQIKIVTIVLEKTDRGVRPGFRDVLLKISEELETQLDDQAMKLLKPPWAKLEGIAAGTGEAT